MGEGKGGSSRPYKGAYCLRRGGERKKGKGRLLLFQEKPPEGEKKAVRSIHTFPGGGKKKVDGNLGHKPREKGKRTDPYLFFSREKEKPFYVLREKGKSARRTGGKRGDGLWGYEKKEREGRVRGAVTL